MADRMSPRDVGLNRPLGHQELATGAEIAVSTTKQTTYFMFSRTSCSMTEICRLRLARGPAGEAWGAPRRPPFSAKIILYSHKAGT